MRVQMKEIVTEGDSRNGIGIPDDAEIPDQSRRRGKVDKVGIGRPDEIETGRGLETERQTGKNPTSLNPKNTGDTNINMLGIHIVKVCLIAKWFGYRMTS